MKKRKKSTKVHLQRVGSYKGKSLYQRTGQKRKRKRTATASYW